MMEKYYNDMIIEIISDKFYSSITTDNSRNYDMVFSEYSYKQDESYSPKYGVILKDKQGDIKKSIIIIGSAGGSTTPHENGVVLDDDNIIIAIGDSVYCLELPTLKLKWKVTTENCYTCFGVYKFLEQYVIHCEGSIICLSKDGEINWEFTGRDIFVTSDGIDNFIIKEDKIIVKDWDGKTYKLSLKGTEEKLF